MIYIDLTNTCFLRQDGEKLFFVHKDDAADGAPWESFDALDLGDYGTTPALRKAAFHARIRGLAPLERIPRHLLLRQT